MLEVLATEVRQKVFVCLFVCFLPYKNAPFEVGEILRSRETTKRIPGKQDIVQILTSFC